jgi:hypothetical protein
MGDQSDNIERMVLMIMIVKTTRTRRSAISTDLRPV